MPRGPADGIGASDDLERRESRAQALVHLGELSSARQALEGAAVAPGSQETWSAFSDPLKTLLRDPLPEEVANHVPRTPFDLDEVSAKEEQRQVHQA